MSRGSRPPNKPLHRTVNSPVQIDLGCSLAAYWVDFGGTGQRCCRPVNADPLGGASTAMRISISAIFLVFAACASAPVPLDPHEVAVLGTTLGQTYDCKAIGPVDGSIHVATDSPDEDVSLGLLRARAMAASKQQVAELGGNVLLLLDISEVDYTSGSFAIRNVGVALMCPEHSTR